MKTSEFDYELDPNRIAQTPVEPRDAARLMVVNRADGSIVHRHFGEIGDYMSADDLLIFNESRVIPARLFAYKLLPSQHGHAASQRGGHVEILLLNQREDGHWHALVRGKRVRKGTRMALVEPESGDSNVDERRWAGIEAMEQVDHDCYINLLNKALSDTNDELREKAKNRLPEI